MKKYILGILTLILLIVQHTAFGQLMPNDVVKWSFEAKKIKDNTYDLIATAKIMDKWHVYTLNPGGDGSQIPTTVAFTANKDYKKIGKLQAAGKTKSEKIEDIGTVNYYVGKSTYTQRIEIAANTTIKGMAEFQTCDEKMCLPPKTVDFTLKITDYTAPAGVNADSLAKAQASMALESAQQDSMRIADSALAAMKKDSAAGSLGAASATTPTAEALGAAAPSVGSGAIEKSSLWQLFLAGLVAGFIAFIMPCIYAMLPITVSFFTKRSKTRAAGIKNATFYSLSIIIIFTLIGALVSLIFTEKTMYELSTSWGFNLFVFIIFIVFGVSLLGAFEITLPSKWSNKLDSKANSNSFMGIFFMALVLVVVSFSCTSAFISSLIVYIVSSGNSLGGVVGFFGFGLAIALPFALGAFFPGLLNGIAKSGGWLNTVKVTMGFLELAMAMKFLSNIDLQYHWRLLDYEIYLAIWIVIFGLLGLYLLGKLKFSHDEELPKNVFGQTYLSVPRLFFAIVALSFTAYLIPGMWGAPLAGVSGFLPERKTLDFNIHDNLIKMQAGAGDASAQPTKYVGTLSSELPGVTTFFDYEEALAAAKKTGKPLLLDFTGHSCVNCRKMEREVLSKPSVLKQMNQHFIVASLYTDDKTKLPEAERYTAKDGTEVTTLGAKNLDIELTKFGAVAQPLYIFVDGEGNVLKNAGGYEKGEARFLGIMEEVKSMKK